MWNGRTVKSERRHNGQSCGLAEHKVFSSAWLNTKVVSLMTPGTSRLHDKIATARKPCK